MKRYNNLYSTICSFENLHLAYLKARKGKKYKMEVLKFSYHVEKKLLKLQKELLNHNYKHGNYRTFVITDPKRRVIKAASFRDRIVHHALCNIIEPIFDKSFIYNSYACRKNKGTHKAVKKIDTFIKSLSDKAKKQGKESADIYCLQCDISKYFASIDHRILMKLLKKKLKDKNVLKLIKEIMQSSYDNKIFKNLLDFRLTGIPIGNLTSQLFANIYLNELDQFMKHQLHAKYYLRYMDDFIIFALKKTKLHSFKILIRKFLRKNLKLIFRFEKANVFPLKQGLSLLGYRFFRHYKLLRKKTVKRFLKRMEHYYVMLNEGRFNEKQLNQSIYSWLAYARIGNSWHLRHVLVKNDVLNNLKLSTINTFF